MGGADDYRIVALNLEASPRTGKHVFSLLDTVERVSGHSVRIEFGPDELFAHCCRSPWAQVLSKRCCEDCHAFIARGSRGRKCDRIAALAFRAVFDRNVASNAQDKFVSFFVGKHGDSMCFLSRSLRRL